MSGENIVNHPTAWARTTMSPEEALKSAERFDWESILIIGYSKDSGELVVRSSCVDRKTALWIVEHARLHVLNVTPD